MDIAQNKDKLVFILTIILALIIGYNIIFKIAQGKIVALRTQIEEEAKKNDILKNIAVLDRKLVTYQQRSFSTTEITEFVDKISQLAGEAGIEIETINPQPALFRQDLVELSVRMPLLSTYHQLGKFLSLIESNQEFIWVRQLSIQKYTASGLGENRNPKIDLTLSGIYLKK